jgi:hypothetical protein
MEAVPVVAVVVVASCIFAIQLLDGSTVRKSPEIAKFEELLNPVMAAKGYVLDDHV